MYVAFTYIMIIAVIAIMHEDMAGSIIFCRTCKVPLSGKDQFLGHQILSHELRVEDAETAWQRAHEGYAFWKEGGIAA